MNSDIIISARDLRRTYGKGAKSFEAVRGVDLDVRRGELYALLGTNGAGKTSTLEILEGLATPSGGSVSVLGHDPYRDRFKVRPHTGVMLQDAGFPPDLTAREVMRMWFGMVTDARAIDDVLAQVDLAHRGDVRVKSLSGGERRRLDLALAIMGRPELLFLDEPTTGLDPQSRRLTWDLITALLKQGVSVMLTTHYLEEAEELADRIAIMHDGVIAREGTIDQIVATENARITFRGDDHGLDLAGLPALAAAPRREREVNIIESIDLQATLAALLAQAAGAQITLPHLEARSASLEQAFLAVAGSEHQPAAA